MWQEPSELRANILLVEDNPANLLALEVILEDSGHNLVKARSGEEALQHLLDQEFAVVLLDVRMDGMDGFATARLIRNRERSRHTPIIFITAHDDSRLLAEEAYSLGAVDFLTKPLVPVILRAKVAVFVDLFEKTEQIKRQAEQLRHLERQEFERKLSAENARFRALTEHSTDAVTLVRVDGTVLYTSPSSRRVLGYEPDEFLGRSGFEIIHPDDRQRIQNRLAELVQEPGTPVTAELRVRHKDDSWRWVECVGTNLLAEPAVKAIVVNFRDITNRRQAIEALRESEERLRRLFEANIVGVGVSDGDGNWLEANDELLRILGCSRDELQSGAVRWRDMTPARYIPLDERGMTEARQQGACTPYEKEYLRKDGFLVPILIGYTPLKEEQDRFICFVLDLTPQKRVEEALRDADRRKDEFLAMLAHELRNPLAPIRNAVQVMKQLGPVDPNLQRAREMIERQVTHLSRLVDDLLDVSRITRGKIKLDKEPVELAAVIARAVETSRPLLDARRHELTVTLPPEPVRVEADATRLAQVVGNLLNNAAKYTEESGHIWLSVEPSPSEVVVRIRDNGIGIPGDLLPRVFDLFTQGDRSLARSEGGLGIGLTLVKSLVEMHGGRVEASSRGPGEGSEFVVRLATLESRSSLATGHSEIESVHRQSSRPRRVLVVDDNRDAADSLAILLRLVGHEVRIAHDGPTALEEAGRSRPEVVVLDIGLPGLDGYEVARRLRGEVGLMNTLLVALTGYGQEEDRRRAEEAGFDAHLVKPADFVALQQLLAN